MLEISFVGEKLQVLAKSAGALFIKQPAAAMKTTVFIIFCRYLATTLQERALHAKR